MNQTGIVMRVINNNWVEVSVKRQTACGHDCTSCGACSGAERYINVKARNDAGAGFGDTVLLESSTREMLKLAAIVYILPILLFIIGWFFHVIAALVGVSIGMTLTFIVNRKLQRHGGITVAAVQILKKSDGENK